jgi:hypothetical protein
MVDEDKGAKWIVGPYREHGSDYAYLLGYAVDTEPGSEGSRIEDRTPVDREFVAAAALEFVGPSTTVDRLRRDLRRGAWVTIDRTADARYTYRDRVHCHPAPSTYQVLLKPLPGGWTHALVLHSRATLLGMHPGESFYVVDPDHVADLEGSGASRERTLMHFIRALDLAITLPVLLAWADYLWDVGQGDGLIERLPAEGVRAWRVWADEAAWAKAIRAGISTRKLPVEGIG